MPYSRYAKSLGSPEQCDETDLYFKFFQSRHTTFTRPDRPPRIAHVIKHELNKNIQFPQNLKEWTSIKFYPMVSRLIFRVSGRAFLGTTLHPKDAFQAALEIRKYLNWPRPLAKYFIPETRRLWKHNARAAEYLTLLIKERNEAEKQPSYEKPMDTLEWIRDQLPEWEKKDYKYQGIIQLLTNAVYNLATWPEYLTELRSEVEEVLRMQNGEWTIESMLQLKKMDSFIKQCQKYSPTIISVQRKAFRTVTLADGNTASYDSNVYENLDEFNGWRYYKMRQVPEEENKYQLVSTSDTQSNFGGSRHACPGRWFANHEIKLVLSALIVEYDIKLRDGETRPKNILFQSQLNLDLNTEIMFKGRS
ncbi:cytochrome P450 [Acephala macrosclerotiorum]|nr:cytochrome P450 [Acephala macrosclerotiorum]